MSAIVRAFLQDIGGDDQALAELAEAIGRKLPQLSEAVTSSPWLNVREAAEYIRAEGRRPEQRIYDLVSQGKLRPHKDGSRSLFHRDDLDQYLGRVPRGAEEAA